MSDETKPRDYDAELDAWLRRAFDHLHHFVFEVRAPATVVALAFGTLAGRLLRRYGPEIFTELGRRMFHHEQVANGWCPHCDGTPRPIADGNGELDLLGEPIRTLGMCRECWDSIRREDDAIAAQEAAESEAPK